MSQGPIGVPESGRLAPELLLEPELLEPELLPEPELLELEPLPEPELPLELPEPELPVGRPVPLELPLADASTPLDPVPLLELALPLELALASDPPRVPDPLSAPDPVPLLLEPPLPLALPVGAGPVADSELLQPIAAFKHVPKPATLISRHTHFMACLL